MNEWVDSNNAMNDYYDGDFPSEHYGKYPENFDAKTIYQGLKFDVARYIEIARDVGGPVLELCCGTGRVALPLAAAGLDVVGVDQFTIFTQMMSPRDAGLIRDVRSLLP